MSSSCQLEKTLAVAGRCRQVDKTDSSDVTWTASEPVHRYKIDLKFQSWWQKFSLQHSAINGRHSSKANLQNMLRSQIEKPHPTWQWEKKNDSSNYDANICLYIKIGNSLQILFKDQHDKEAVTKTMKQRFETQTQDFGLNFLLLGHQPLLQLDLWASCTRTTMPVLCKYYNINNITCHIELSTVNEIINRK